MTTRTISVDVDVDVSVTKTVAIDVDLSSFDDDDIRTEYELRFNEVPTIDRADELADLIAEASRISPHARRAYALLREAIPNLETLSARQSLIAGRMGDAA